MITKHMFELSFNTDNAAFEDSWQHETAAILDGVRNKVLRGHDHGLVFDTNGNKIGSWYVDQDHVDA